MKLLDILKKSIMPGVLGLITIDSYRLQKGGHFQELFNLEKSKNDIIQQIQTEL
jgi:hypothetical protein